MTDDITVQQQPIDTALLLLSQEVGRIAERQMQVVGRLDELTKAVAAGAGKRDLTHALVPVIGASIALAVSSVGLNITTLILLIDHLVK